MFLFNVWMVLAPLSSAPKHILCSLTRVWDAKYMWGVWDSSQVLILTFEFSSVVSRRPHHLMPLNCFSCSPLFAFLPIPPLSFPFSFLSLPHFPPCIPSSTLSSVSLLLYISPLAHSSLVNASTPPPFAPSLPGEWQTHKCSHDSGGGVSVTAIAVVTGAGLSLGANTASASAAEPLSPWRQTERKTDRQTDRLRKRERETIAIIPPSFTNPLPFSNQTISMTVRHSHFANCSPKTFNFRRRRPAADGWKRLVCAGICCNLTPRPESSTPGYYAFAPHCHGSLNFFGWGIGGDGEVGEVGCTGRERV